MKRLVMCAAVMMLGCGGSDGAAPRDVTASWTISIRDLDTSAIWCEGAMNLASHDGAVTGAFTCAGPAPSGWGALGGPITGDAHGNAVLLNLKPGTDGWIVDAALSPDAKTIFGECWQGSVKMKWEAHRG